ncbi:MAG: hypothetical protein R3D98_15765 [Candidatus Krumholzibacteriia bacterium]
MRIWAWISGAASSGALHAVYCILNTRFVIFGVEASKLCLLDGAIITKNCRLLFANPIPGRKIRHFTLAPHELVPFIQ